MDVGKHPMRKLDLFRGAGTLLGAFGHAKITEVRLPKECSDACPANKIVKNERIDEWFKWMNKWVHAWMRWHLSKSRFTRQRRTLAALRDLRARRGLHTPVVTLHKNNEKNGHKKKRAHRPTFESQPNRTAVHPPVAYPAACGRCPCKTDSVGGTGEAREHYHFSTLTPTRSPKTIVKHQRGSS